MTVGAGLSIAITEKDQTVQNRFMRQLAEGRSNAVGSFTIASNVTSTVVTAVNCAPTSVVIGTPADSTAAADYGLIYFTSSTGSFVAHHSSNGVSRTHFYAVIG